MVASLLSSALQFIKLGLSKLMNGLSWAFSRFVCPAMMTDRPLFTMAFRLIMAIIALSVATYSYWNVRKCNFSKEVNDKCTRTYHQILGVVLVWYILTVSLI